MADNTKIDFQVIYWLTQRLSSQKYTVDQKHGQFEKVIAAV